MARARQLDETAGRVVGGAIALAMCFRASDASTGQMSPAQLFVLLALPLMSVLTDAFRLATLAAGMRKDTGTRKPFQEKNMNTYRVTFVVDGHRYAETVEAQTHQDARRLIQARYPNAMIWNVQRIG